LSPPRSPEFTSPKLNSPPPKTSSANENQLEQSIFFVQEAELKLTSLERRQQKDQEQSKKDEYYEEVRFGEAKNESSPRDHVKEGSKTEEEEDDGAYEEVQVREYENWNR